MGIWIFRALLVVALAAGRVWAAPAYPLRVAENGRHIVDRTGEEVIFQMESGWHVMTRLTPPEVIEYFENRRAKGFNAILVMFPMPEWDGDITNVFGEPPFLVPGDFSTPNEAYFAHADWVIEQAHARGLTLFLACAYVGWECVNEGFCDDMKQAGTAGMRDWGRWLGNRYRDQPNIVWVHGGDADAGAHGAMDVVDAVALGIRDVDPNHLHTAHCNRFNSALDCYDRPWLDFNTTYADCHQTPAELRTDYERSPGMPFVYIEGRYEFEKDWTDVCMRSQAYWSVLGGATGHVFGSGTMWGFFEGWQTAMESTGSSSMGHLADLVRSRPWELLVPDGSHTVLTAGYGDIDGSSYAPAARTSDGNTVIIYTPTARTLTVDMDQVSGNLAVCWWYDPATGENSAIGSFSTQGSRNFTPPSGGDWVLVLDNGAARFPPPGRAVPTRKRSWGTFKRSFGSN